MGLDMNFVVAKKILKDEMVMFNKMLHESNDNMRYLIEEEILNFCHDKGLETSYQEINELSFNISSKIMDEENGGNYPTRLIELNRELSEVSSEQYFRKHSDLHGYISTEYWNQFYKGDNLEYVLLDKYSILEILDYSKECLKDFDSSKKYLGFFWGQSTPEDWKTTIEMCEKFLDEIDFEQNAVYYYAWY